jgi:prepilin-type processing-associated H-X9-DG protein
MNLNPTITRFQALALAAVILFGLAILFPAAGLARGWGKLEICMANLHILGRAWVAYAEDNSGKLVNGMVPRDSRYAVQQYWLTTTTFNGPFKDNAWWVNPPHNASGVYTGDPISPPCPLADEDNGIRSGKLFPYVGASAAFHCPSDLSYRRTSSRGGKRSYSITDLMHGERPNSPECADLYSQIVRPSAKMVYVENTDERGWNMGCWMMNYPQYSSWGWIDAMVVFHDRKSTIGFADGHAEFHPWQDTMVVSGIERVTPSLSSDLNYLGSIYLPKR